MLLLQSNDVDYHVGAVELGSVLSMHPFIH